MKVVTAVATGQLTQKLTVNAKGEVAALATPTAWTAFGNWMFSHGLLHRNPNNTALPPFTNEFLPGEGIGKSEE